MSKKWTLLEAPEPAEDEHTRGTSYLRIGSAPLPFVGSLDSMTGRHPDHGFTDAASGCGEDLAALAHVVARGGAFLDDRRERCYPTSLDETAAGQSDVSALSPQLAQALDPQLAQTPGPQQRVAAAKDKLAAAEEDLAALRSILRAVLDSPGDWLQNLQQARQAASQRAAALNNAYQNAKLTQDEGAQPIDRRFAPNFSSKAARRRQSALLHTRGGWRDHTDGNRIVTTRGDKLEVIHGNYRMVVLGRQRYPKNALHHNVLPGWDLSGGHVDEDTTTVAEEQVISWKRRNNGTWYTLDTMTKMDTQGESSGDSHGTSYGHFQLTMTGSDSPSDSWHAAEDCSDPHCRINPIVHNASWATEMRSYTGSAKWPIPEIRDVSWVDEMLSYSHSDSLVDRTHVADAMTSNATVSGSISDHTSADTFSSTTTCGTMLDMRTTGITSEIMLGDMSDTTIGTVTSLALTNSLNLTLGPQLDIMAAAVATVNIGATADVFIGAKADLSLTGSVTFQFGSVSQMSTALNCQLALVDTSTALVSSVRGAIISR